MRSFANYDKKRFHQKIIDIYISIACQQDIFIDRDLCALSPNGFFIRNDGIIKCTKTKNQQNIIISEQSSDVNQVLLYYIADNKVEYSSSSMAMYNGTDSRIKRLLKPVKPYCLEPLFNHVFYASNTPRYNKNIYIYNITLQNNNTFNLTEEKKLTINYFREKMIPFNRKIIDGAEFIKSDFDIMAYNKSTIPSIYVVSDLYYIIIDMKKDTKLKITVEEFDSCYKQKNFSDDLERYKYILNYVKEKFQKDTTNVYEKILENKQNHNNDIFLGELIKHKAGLCIEKSLLFKLLSDFVDLSATLIDGFFLDENRAHVISGHVWIIININNENMILDVDDSMILSFDNIQNKTMISRYYSTAKLFRNLCKKNHIDIGIVC